MPLNWVDRQDGVDDILAEDINKIAHSVIDLEKNSAKYANAIKAVASGTAIRLQDVSPLEHELKVKLTSDTEGNLSAVSLKASGKNLFATLDTLHKPPLSIVGVTISQEEDGTLLFNGTSTNASGFYVPLNLPKGDYTVSFKNDKTVGSSAGTSNSLYGVLRSGTKWLRTVYFNTKNVKATLLKNDNWQDADTITDALFGFPAGITFDNFKIKPQLEIGSSETDYVPYIAPKIYPVNADGTVDGITLISPVMSLFTDNTDAQIMAEYNKDANAVINNLVERIIAIENAILNS